ncbi:uncharacterized protein NEMAJ01_0273 [Nematocida major]|uniref:uncharacterized protein n=1 Tax=Nematocida major TaxID=1912982 RepID=UPI0020088F1D|nr:uncharacterized protein NEMAJ01_0273 [Nematocida major]KAH9385377.1 hypothetical protein NEMAJ01_0273 [Nematocida major]
MDPVIKGLRDVKNALPKGSTTLCGSKLMKRPNCETMMEVIEDTLEKVHAQYMVRISESIVNGSCMDKAVHVQLTRVLDLFQKTKKRVLLTVKDSRQDPVESEYLFKVLQMLKYVS